MITRISSVDGSTRPPPADKHSPGNGAFMKGVKMNRYSGLYTFDNENHRYIPVGQADGIIDCFDYATKEPLIKDPKIRKSVKAWAECNNIISVQFDANWRGFRHDNAVITLWEDLPLEDNKIYTIEELCGEEE
jgi:hypothetical protein